MEVYRLSREKYAHQLSGYGAALKGARWNSKGFELIYAAQNRSLAMAEVAVHLTLATLPGDFMMMTITIPDTLMMEEVLPSALPDEWNSFPYSTATQTIGDKFITNNNTPLLKVPSAVTFGDYNILINPRHPAFALISIKQVENFRFDHRLFK